jgi:autotransporter family porin
MQQLAGWRNTISGIALSLLLLASLGSCGNARGSGTTATPTHGGVNVSVPLRATQAAQATSTSLATSPPTSTGMEGLLPPGSTLPDEATCAARVQRSSFEPRPQNYTANHIVPTSTQIASLTAWGSAMGMSNQADTLRTQISGNFTGTTDEIIQWAACKWGMPTDLVRAEAVVESTWRQSQLGDYTTDQAYCPPGMWNGSSCYQSYGLLQIKWYYFQSTWPMARDDTAFNVEFVYGILRSCYEGWTTYLSQNAPIAGYASYQAGDIWGCVGRWFSGRWYTQDAVDYIAKVKSAFDTKTWLKQGF